MKKVILVLLIMVLLPISVYADSEPVVSNIYSKKGNVGSEVVFDLIDCDSIKCDGTVTYNKDELELVSIEHTIPNNLDDVVSPEYGNFKWITPDTSVDGSIKFDFNILSGYEELDNHVLFTFKVKSRPSNGIVKIHYESDNSMLARYDKEIEIEPTIISDSCVITRKDGNDSTYLIISLLVNLILLVLLVLQFILNNKNKK